MKRKHLLIISAVVLISLLAIGGASAFSVGNVDGEWSQVDVGGALPDAYCSRWASGGLTTAMWRNSWWNQTYWDGPPPPAGTFDTDENIVFMGEMNGSTGGKLLIWTM